MLRHRISPEEFQRMVEAGVFPEDLRLELVEGELVEMSPIGPRHAAKLSACAPMLQRNHPQRALHQGLSGVPTAAKAAVGYLARLLAHLAPLTPHKAILVVQSPLAVGESVLYPDLALLKPRPDFYENAIPEAKDALLVVEVSDTTLGYDLEAKRPLYLKAGVPEVWILDLKGRRALVHRGEEVQVLGPGETIEALGVRIPVEEVV